MADVEEYMCPRCAYNLHGIPESRCPECGFGFDHVGLKTLGAHEANRLFYARHRVTLLSLAASVLTAAPIVQAVLGSLVPRLLIVVALLVLLLPVRERLAEPDPARFPSSWAGYVWILPGLGFVGIITTLYPLLGAFGASIALGRAWGGAFTLPRVMPHSELSLPPGPRQLLRRSGHLMFACLGVASLLVLAAWGAL